MEVLPGTQAPCNDPPMLQSDSGSAALFNPCGLTVTADGRVYIADTGHHRICVVKDGVLSVLAGSGARGCVDGHGTDAMFAHPCGLAVSPDGYLFVADCGNHRIRQVAPDGEVTTIAGSGQPAHRDGHGRHACFYNPCGIAIDYVNNDVLFVADYSNNRVRAVSRSGLVSTIAKDADSPHDSPLDSPYGIAVHMETPSNGGVAEATIFVSSYHSHSLARISAGGRVSIIAGEDGGCAEGKFNAPNGLAVDADGVLYVADSGNHCVRRVSPDGEVSTLAGDGCPSLSPSGLNSPCGLCVCQLPGRGPVLLIADRANSCVRLLPVDALPPLLLAPSTLKEDLSVLLDGGSNGYATGEALFEVEGRKLRAPKALLCARCPHFRAMFESGMRESRGEAVQVGEVSYAVYRALLDYLLCDDVAKGLPTELLLELMMLANAYGVLRLEQMCAGKLTRRLDSENAEYIGHYAQLIGSGHLGRAASKVLPRSIMCQKAAEVRDDSVRDDSMDAAPTMREAPTMNEVELG